MHEEKRCSFILNILKLLACKTWVGTFYAIRSWWFADNSLLIAGKFFFVLLLLQVEPYVLHLHLLLQKHLLSFRNNIRLVTEIAYQTFIFCSRIMNNWKTWLSVYLFTSYLYNIYLINDASSFRTKGRGEGGWK